MLLPFFAIFNKHPYFKAAIRDIWEMEYRVKPEYRRHRKKYFSFGVEQGACQGLDLIMEEQVANMIATTVKRSESGPVVASMMVESSRELRNAFLKQGGKNPMRELNRVMKLFYIILKYTI